MNAETLLQIITSLVYLCPLFCVLYLGKHWADWRRYVMFAHIPVFLSVFLVNVWVIFSPIYQAEVSAYSRWIIHSVALALLLFLALDHWLRSKGILLRKNNNNNETDTWNQHKWLTHLH